MKGNPKVIKELNDAPREELTAIHQYFVHAEMCEKEVLIERVLFLDGTPSMEPLKPTVGTTVPHD
jgi:bacterioferritin